MNGLWQKAGAWIKFVLMLVVVAYAVAFVLLNSGQAVNLWLFLGVRPQVSLLLLLFLMLALGAAIALSWRAAVKSIRQLRHLFAARPAEGRQTGPDGKSAG